jgi:LysR family cyn operon transcriptional activator
MELEQLRQIVAISEEGSISAAAKKLRISQSALSRSVSRLEDDLHQQLFIRERGGVQLNDTGQVAVKHAKTVLREVQLLRDAVDEQAKRVRTLRIATCAPAPLWYLSHRLTHDFTGAIMTTQTLNEEAVRTQVLDGTIDLGIVRTPLNLPSVFCIKLLTENLQVAVRPNSPLANRSSVTFKDIDGMDFMVYSGIGSWMDIHRDKMPHSHFILQNDRMVFVDLANSSDVPVFASDVTHEVVRPSGRIRIPISDPEAHATFYLLARKDSGMMVRAIVRSVSRH